MYDYPPNIMYDYMPFYGGFSGVLLGIWIICMAAVVLSIIATWRLFQKAGQPGWASIVPFYNGYVLYKITWGNGWMFFVLVALSVLCGIPVLGALCAIAAVVIQCITMWKLAEAFGEGIGFTLGLILLPFIFQMILAFGHYEYLGIPQDGVSTERAEAAIRARQQNMTYTQPAPESRPAVTYTQPQQPVQPAASEHAEQPAPSDSDTQN